MDGDGLVVPQLPTFPERIAESVALDLGERRLLIEPRKVGDPLVLTWLDRCRAVGVRLQVVPTELDEIIAWRQSGFRLSARSSSGAAEAALENREAALELLFKAADYRASDIHLLMRGSHAEVQYRIKGELRVAGRLSQAEGEAIARAFYQGIAVVKDSSYTPLEVQNAQISGPIVQDRGLSSVRIVRGPAYPVEAGGGFMVLRLQPGDLVSSRKRPSDLPPLVHPRAPGGELRLETMGYTGKQAEKLKFLVEGSSGIVIFTGPTGSGKTTSIHELLKEAARRSPGKRQVAIEKPVEYPMPWAVQLSITGDDEGNDEGAAFGDYLRHSLRMDPDSIFLGEIRSAGVALTAFEASLTGHKVYTTVHTMDPYAAPDRIEIMDAARLPRRMFCNSKMIRGIVNQRLVPRLCPHCAVALSADMHRLIEPRLMGALRTYGDLDAVRLRGPGCGECGHDGIKDRFAVAEVIVTDAELMRDFVEHGADMARRNYRARGDTDRSVLHSAMMRVLDGEIDPRDVGENVDVVVPLEQVDQ